MHFVIIIWLSIVAAVCGSWVGNLLKLTDCDFEPNYRCEALHGAGLIPVVSVITVWADTDKKEP